MSLKKEVTYRRAGSSSRKYGNGPLFVKMTTLICEMASHAGFEEPFSNIDGTFSKHPRFAQTIHADNAIESLSELCLIHDYDYTTTVDWLKEHFDRENCPHKNYDWLGCVYEDVFIPNLGRWATIVITATSRKSLSDLLYQEVRILSAAKDFLKRYQKEKYATRFLVKETLCAKHLPYEEIEIHFEVLCPSMSILIPFKVIPRIASQFGDWDDFMLFSAQTILIDFI